MTSSKQACLIEQSDCGLTDQDPVCTKCGLDTRVRWYVNEEAALLATAQAQARYWKSFAENNAILNTTVAADPHATSVTESRLSGVREKEVVFIVSYAAFCFVVAIAVWLVVLNLISSRFSTQFNAVISFSTSQVKPAKSDFLNPAKKVGFIVTGDGNNVDWMIGSYERLVSFKVLYPLATIFKLDSLISLLFVGLLGGFVIFSGSKEEAKNKLFRHKNECVF